MPGTAVDNLNRWIVQQDRGAWRNLIQQEEFTDDEALDYMRETREEGDRNMPYITATTATDGVCETTTNGINDMYWTRDTNNAVFHTAPPGVSISGVMYSERGEKEIVIRDEELRERVEQLGTQVKLLSDLVGEMKEFIISMGFDKLMEGESDGKKTER